MPVNENQCAVGSAFDHLFFLAVPIMAVLKMYSATSGHGASFAPPRPGMREYSEDVGSPGSAAMMEETDKADDGNAEAGRDGDSSVKTAVMTACSALTSLTAQHHINVRAKGGSMVGISHLIDPVKDLLRKKHLDYEYHLTHLSSNHHKEVGPGLHVHSVYLSTHLPAVRDRAAHIEQYCAENEFFDFINFSLLRAFSGVVSPESTIFIMDQGLILGFAVFLPIIATSLLLGCSEELLALESCDNAVECFDNYCRAVTVGKLRRYRMCFVFLEKKLSELIVGFCPRFAQKN